MLWLALGSWSLPCAKNYIRAEKLQQLAADSSRRSLGLAWLVAHHQQHDYFTAEVLVAGYYVVSLLDLATGNKTLVQPATLGTPYKRVCCI